MRAAKGALRQCLAGIFSFSTWIPTASHHKGILCLARAKLPDSPMGEQMFSINQVFLNYSDISHTFQTRDDEALSETQVFWSWTSAVFTGRPFQGEQCLVSYSNPDATQRTVLSQQALMEQKRVSSFKTHNSWWNISCLCGKYVRRHFHKTKRQTKTQMEHK